MSKRTREVFTSAAVKKKKKKEKLRKISLNKFQPSVCEIHYNLSPNTHTQHMHMNKEISWNKIKGKLSNELLKGNFAFFVPIKTHLQCDSDERAA